MVGGLGETVVEGLAVPAHLFVRSGKLIGRQFLLGEPVTLGRSPDNVIHLDDQKVSRHHARIEGGDGRYFIEDLGSSNGTTVNGQLINQKTALQIGDQIAIGSTLFELMN